MAHRHRLYATVEQSVVLQAHCADAPTIWNAALDAVELLIGSGKRDSRYPALSERPLPAPRPAPGAAAIECELESAARYAASALAPAKRRAYERDWHVFAGWCVARGLRPMPAAPETVAAFLAAEADREFRPVTIGKRVAAIAAAHRAQDEPNPCDSGAVAAVLAGIRRQLNHLSAELAADLADDLLQPLGDRSDEHLAPVFRAAPRARRGPNRPVGRTPRPSPTRSESRSRRPARRAVGRTWSARLDRFLGCNGSPAPQGARVYTDDKPISAV